MYKLHTGKIQTDYRKLLFTIFYRAEIQMFINIHPHFQREEGDNIIELQKHLLMHFFSTNIENQFFSKNIYSAKLVETEPNISNESTVTVVVFSKQRAKRLVL